MILVVFWRPDQNGKMSSSGVLTDSQLATIVNGDASTVRFFPNVTVGRTTIGAYALVNDAVDAAARFDAKFMDQLSNAARVATTLPVTNVAAYLTQCERSTDCGWWKNCCGVTNATHVVPKGIQPPLPAG